jgi:hypothetical protein
MITILGIDIQVYEKVLTAPKSEIVLDYIKAAKEGRGLAKKTLRFLKV